MLKEILLPDLGEGISSADVSEILVSPGDIVSADDIILVLESDKASMEIPSEDNGIVKKVFVSQGDQVTTGEILVVMEVVSGATQPLKNKKEEEKSAPKKPPEKKASTKIKEAVKVVSSEKPFASPSVRRLSRELDIDLSIIKATGPKGRTTKDDLHSFIKQKMVQGVGGSNYIQPQIDFSQWGEVENKPLTKIQKITGSRLQQAWQTVPHVSQFDEADISILDDKRQDYIKEGHKKNIKVTFLPFIMKAVIKTLREYPVFNSSLDHKTENLIVKSYYNLGIAVDTPTGLIVPVIKNAEKKSILILSKELMDISERARRGKLKPDEIKGGSFSISSLGGIGGTYFTPIINPPEVAILGISKSRWKLLYNHKTNEIVPTLTMPFSLSYDHRVIDGAIGAAFTSFFSNAVLDSSTFD
jgi:pyruvate dehydrogenase E2 component (dihydrolipoamide acetyltransferase)